MKIVFATNNQHKLEEVRQILGPEFEVLSLNDIGCHEELPETCPTLQGNAFQKAKYVYDHYHIDCFADDTGLEVDALDGEPGIYSARYAAMAASSPSGSSSSSGPSSPSSPIKSHDSEANMTLLLQKLGENNNRRARFRTVIALIQMLHGMECIWSLKFFEGIVEGEITRERSGAEGFGYDPIFRPDGYDKTFAELGADVKNQISHRARATQKLCEFLIKIEH